MSLNILTAMSNKYGSDPNYVLAGGGNTSFKDAGVMYVKGSGTALADIQPHQFVQMDMNKLHAMLEKDYSPEDDKREAEALADMLAARLPGEEAKRPSVEAILHALFPYKYVLHLHPALVNGLTCGKNGEKHCRDLFGDIAVWIKLTKPGYILALACKKAFTESQAKTGEFPKITILQNHGIFIAADTVEEIEATMSNVMTKLKTKSEPDFSAIDYCKDSVSHIVPALRMLYSPTGMASAVFCTSKQVMDVVSDEKRFIRALGKPFSPDHIVYCKDEPLFINTDADIKKAFENYCTKKGYAPKIIAIKGLGFIALGSTKKEAETAKLLFLDAIKVAFYSESFGGPLPLPDAFTDFILNWEIEAYRTRAAFDAEKSTKRLEGKIAIVTGSAQGFGKGIAMSLAAEGAYIVVADINAAGAEKTSAELNETYGKYCSIPVAVNVTDEASVEDMIHEAVANFGGLDLLVSNAGVLRAGSVFELTKESFDFVTSVNYTAYFLCAKHAAKIMKLQNEMSPDYLSDIIEINSKSGLAGSNKNFAYAGSKFGGIGLTQSFALEFIEYGIKVNAVCPGNYLDGPLWSDPENGLFKQYLDAGKVKGATSLADVRKYYEDRVPMRRGCEIADVVRAILYAVEQQYETGQAIPVTGGQVMLG
ncbi:MAG: SDR family NAD(P)-dependent oxidoreductase [Defluviitaleaceae bacterium]|nr:SDR family NAD(P)-dependent oxidoreductase [Defluviitaleaceae bacterium]